MDSIKKLNYVDIERNKTKKRKLYGWLANVYRKHLKRYVIIRKTVRLVYTNILPVFYRLIFPYMGGSVLRYSKRWRKLVSQRDFVTKEGLVILPIFKKTNISVKTPLVFPLSEKHNLTPHKKSNTFPEVFVTSISNGMVIGGSNLTFYKDDVIYHDLINLNDDYTSEELQGYVCVRPKQNKMRLLVYDDNVVEIQQAATFVDACANNYAHWLSEVLPRIAVFCSIKEYEEIPIIINSGLHQNLLDSLSLVVNTNRVIYRLPVQKQLKVEKLFITSATGYVPFDVRPIKNAQHSHDGMFSPQALDFMRRNILNSIKSINNNATLPKNIFIMRNSKSRSVQNVGELKDILISKGFELFEPEKSTFIEQVKIFSNANHVISPTGAALGSAIFCSSSCQVTVLMGIHKNMIYRYWVEMFKFNQAKVNYILGKIVDNAGLGIHGDYIIDKNDLLAFLESIDE
jgi:capsular polysaccharide biosynthesis protein